MDYKSLFFDFGNVIAFFDHRRACHRLASFSNGRFSEDDVYEDLFQSGGLEQQYDLGKISTGYFIDEIGHKFKLSVEPCQIERAWCDIFSLNDQLIEILYKLKANQHRLFLASNTNELHYNWIKEKYTNELSIFNDEVISFKIGFRKPEKGFFEYCVERSGVLSSECIFIDDRLDFVNIAREVGLIGVWYTTLLDFSDDIEALGIKVK